MTKDQLAQMPTLPVSSVTLATRCPSQNNKGGNTARCQAQVALNSGLGSGKGGGGHRHGGKAVGSWAGPGTVQCDSWN